MRVLGLLLLFAALPAQAVLRLDTGEGVVDLYGKSYALVVGASGYKYWPKLPGVKRDVALVKAALEKHGFAVTTVMDPTRGDYDQAMRSFISRYGQDQSNRLLFYYAGHGHTIKGAQGPEMGYMIPVDAPLPGKDRGRLRAAAISMLEREIYAKQIDAKHALFVFDSCFWGSIFGLTRDIPAPILDRATKRVRQFITAGAADQEVPDDSAVRRQFVAGLGGEADLNHDGYVTGSELSQFLEYTVINYTRGAQTPQYGKIRDPFLDKGDFVFFLPRSARKGVGKLQPPAVQTDPAPEVPASEQPRRLRPGW